MEDSDEYELVRCINPQWCVLFKPSTGTYLDVLLRKDVFVDMAGRVSLASPVKCKVELGPYKDGAFRDSAVYVDKHANSDQGASQGRYGRDGYYKKPKN